MWPNITCLYKINLAALFKLQTRYDGGLDLGGAVERKRITSSILKENMCYCGNSKTTAWEEAEVPKRT